LLALGDLDGLVREVDRLAVRESWDEVLVLREACLAATEETGRQLWGPARYAAYRTALDAPAAMAAAMLEPGVVRFGLGPLTEVVAQNHTFDELAPHLDASLLRVVAQERVLRGEDLRDDPRALGEPDDPPLVLQPFEPDYILPEYRASERLDGAVPDPSEDPDADWRTVDCAGRVGPTGPGAVGGPVVPPTGALVRALEDVVAPWATQSGGELRVQVVRGSAQDACCAVLEGRADAVRAGAIDVTTLLRLLAFAGASGGVHGRRRGGAAGRSLAWWVVRCATGLDRVAQLDVEELEFRLEDLERFAFRVPEEASWRLEIALASSAGCHNDEVSVAAAAAAQEWAVAIAAFDRSEPDDGSEGGPDDGSSDVRPGPDGATQAREDPAPW